MRKNKLLLSFILGCILFLGGTVGVNATTLNNDTSDIIKFPTQYTTSSKISVTNLTGYTTYYQVIRVNNGSLLATSIDNYFNAQVELNKLTDTNSTAYLEAQSKLNTYKEDVTANAPDYVTNDWATSVNDNIYDNTIVTNTTDARYIVWVKVVSGSTTIYDFNAYSFRTYGSTSVTNPNTGISTTSLYVGVAVLVIAGTYLVISKNKERYE